MENAYLTFDPIDAAPINTLLGHSITYRIATGPREGQKVFTLATLLCELSPTLYAISVNRVVIFDLTA